jgi:hypothetical protein
MPIPTIVIQAVPGKCFTKESANMMPKRNLGHEITISMVCKMLWLYFVEMIVTKAQNVHKMRS